MFLTNISGNGHAHVCPATLGQLCAGSPGRFICGGRCTGEPDQDFLKFGLAIIGRHRGAESEWRTSEGRDRRPPIRSSSLSIEIALVADPETAVCPF